MNIEDVRCKIEKSVNIKESVNLAFIYAALASSGKDNIYSAIDLEDTIITKYKMLTPDIDIPVDFNENTLHVMSEVYLSGGHTRLCERLAKMDILCPDLLITRDSNRSAISRISNYFDNVFITELEEIEDRISYFISVISNYKRIIMHIHPDDIEFVIALGRVKYENVSNLDIYFVNHSDHVFSFGKSLPKVVYQISSRGYEIQKLNNETCYYSSFLGIPLDFKVKPFIEVESKNHIMVGSSYKMKPNHKYSAPKIVDFILSNDKQNIFYVVGARKSDYWWWLIKFKYRHRLIILPSLTYDEYLSVVKLCDTCIDSVPVIGGTAFVEMYLNGLKPKGVFTGICGYTPLDLVKVKSNEELINNNYNDFDTLYSEVVNVHDFINVKNRYQDAMSGIYHELPLSLNLYKNDLNVLVESKSELSFKLVKIICNLNCLSFYDKVMILFHEFYVFSFIKNKFFNMINKYI
ncbi:TPA: hypothetical protein ACX6RT_003441 [Photobacterium damselae]